MRGFWHMTALATCASISYVLTEQMFFLIIGLLWLTFLIFLKRLNLLPFIISLAALIFFSYYIPTLSDPKLEQIDEQHIQLTGKVVQPLEQTLKKLQFTVRDSKADEKYLVLYFPQEDEYISESSKQSIKYGATCTLKGTVNLPERARNPGQFDFFNYYVERGLTVQIIIDTLEQIDCKGSSIFHPLFKLREFLLHEVQQSMSEMTAPWIQALVLGERGNLDERTIDIFQRWGLSHLLAISGLHVGIIIASLYFIIVRCGILTKESAEWVLIIFLPIYSIIAGGEPSVLRSSLMVLIFLIINKVRLSFHLQDTISVVFLILIIVNPLFVYHIGFQFSFLVTFALILSRQWLQQTTSPLWQLLIICYVSQMAILPLQFHYFHTFQPLSIFVNFIIVPYFSLFVIPFMFFLVPLFLMAPIVAEFLLVLFEPLQKLIINILYIIDEHFYIPFVLSDFPPAMMFIYYLTFSLSIIFIQRNKLQRAFKYSLLFISLLILMALRPFFSPEGVITMLDIGQGEAIVVELPYRRGVFLIDAGASVSFEDYEVTDDVYEQTIKPFLYSRGIQTVDALLLSHGHIDHNGSSQYIIEDFNTSLVVVSEFYEPRDDEHKLWQEKNVQTVRLTGGDLFTLKGQPFRVISPMTDTFDIDDNSLVLQSTFGGKTWLFTGDISQSVERKIKATYPELTIDVLKVAHHGSRTSSAAEFIEHIRPDYALISVGQNNAYNHPHDEVIATLAEANVTILRTDYYGAIQYIFTKEDGTFFTFLP